MTTLRKIDRFGIASAGLAEVRSIIAGVGVEGGVRAPF